ncbi:NfeD family protein [Jannaschia sp. 2305UL9-9]|uniref:NfeD family protein n=1 Tax=Jannaschia sp. 2305UL9-9 TaxID=3121638 RepID=UPI003528C018
MEWWAWMLAGIALAVAEMILPGFILLGFAMGAGLVGLGLLTGTLGGLTAMAGDYGFASLLLLFALLSLAAWLGLRAAFGPPGARPTTFDEDVND